MTQTYSEILNAYQADAIRTAKLFPTIQMNLMHVALGVSSEYFEWVTAPADDVREELGDQMWYLALAAHVLSVKLGHLVAPQGGAPNWPSWSEWLEDQGTLVSSIKRVAIYGKAVDDLAGTILDALGRVAAGTAYLLAGDGTDLAQLKAGLDANIAKLRTRYPDAYSDVAAEARADKGGLSALES